MGEVGKALELLNNRVKDIKLRIRLQSLVVNANKEDELKSQANNKPESLKSGYNRRDLLLPAGLLVFVGSYFTCNNFFNKLS
jgi:hypothetical protein